jgi:hypothetical protein
MSGALASGVACQLPDEQLPQRLSAIASLAKRFLVSEREEGSTLRLTYGAAAAPELTALMQAEKECCGFLGFQMSRTAGYVHLSITAPAGADKFGRDLMDHFRGQARPQAGCGAAACGCT